MIIEFKGFASRPAYEIFDITTKVDGNGVRPDVGHLKKACVDKMIVQYNKAGDKNAPNVKYESGNEGNNMTRILSLLDPGKVNLQVMKRILTGKEFADGKLLQTKFRNFQEFLIRKDTPIRNRKTSESTGRVLRRAVTEGFWKLC